VESGVVDAETVAVSEVSEVSEETSPKETILIHGGTLGRDAILFFKEHSLIHIWPFNPDQLNTNSYDLRLGSNYYTTLDTDEIGCQIPPEDIVTQTDTTILDPYNETEVKALWHLKKAVRIRDHVAAFTKVLTKESMELHLARNSEIIILNPGDMILAHTVEFIGAREKIFGNISSRSSAERTFIDVCGSAGFGDIGYCNRWTMEISNKFTRPILLVAGNRYSQMEFRMVVTVNTPESIANQMNYVHGADTKYQTMDAASFIINGAQVVKDWQPQAMLPKKYKDREMVVVAEKGERVENGEKDIAPPARAECTEVLDLGILSE